MRRWIADLGAVALLVAGGILFILVNFGWPSYWAGVFSTPATFGALRHVLLATVFLPFLVRAWAGRDSDDDRGGEAFILLGVNLAVVAVVVWLVATLPRAALLATIVIGLQGALTFRAWRQARSARPR